MKGGHLPLYDILKITSTCKNLYALLNEAYWEHLLKSHFPSYYFVHEANYNQVHDITWKSKYRQAYEALSYRFIGSVNLQQSRVVHFGPLLDTATIENIINDTGELAPPLKVHHNAYYEETEFVESPDPWMTSLDDTFEINKNERSFLHGSIVHNNHLYFACNTVDDHISILCFNLDTNKQVWGKEVVVDIWRNEKPAIIAFENKVFYTEIDKVVCVEALTGQTLFQLGHDQTEPPPKKLKSGYTRDLEYFPQLAIEGDFIVWLAAKKRLLMVANWKKQEVHAVFEFDKLGQFQVASRFVVANGSMYFNVYTHGHDEAPFCIALDLAFKSKNPKITEKWRFGRKGGGIDTPNDVAPCVYGDIVFDFFYSPTYCDEDRLPWAWIVALDAHSGKLIWRLKFYPGETTDVSQLYPRSFYILEGTASFAERQKQRLLRKANQQPISDKAENPSNNKYEEVGKYVDNTSEKTETTAQAEEKKVIDQEAEIEHEKDAAVAVRSAADEGEEEEKEDGEEDDEEEEAKATEQARFEAKEEGFREEIVHDKVGKIPPRGEVDEYENVSDVTIRPKTQHTKFAILKFSLEQAVSSVGRTAEGAVVAETGELLYLIKRRYD